MPFGERRHSHHPKGRYVCFIAYSKSEYPKDEPQRLQATARIGHAKSYAYDGLAKLGRAIRSTPGTNGPPPAPRPNPPRHARAHEMAYVALAVRVVPQQENGDYASPDSMSDLRLE